MQPGLWFYIFLPLVVLFYYFYILKLFYSNIHNVFLQPHTNICMYQHIYVYEYMHTHISIKISTTKICLFIHMNTFGYFFLNIQSSVFFFFFVIFYLPSAWRTSFVISCNKVLLETYIFCFCLNNVLILFSFLKDIFTGYRILAWYFIYFKHFSNSVSFSSDLNLFLMNCLP